MTILTIPTSKPSFRPWEGENVRNLPYPQIITFICRSGVCGMYFGCQHTRKKLEMRREIVLIAMSEILILDLSLLINDYLPEETMENLMFRICKEMHFDFMHMHGIKTITNRNLLDCWKVSYCLKHLPHDSIAI
jgi:hypothetical protein